MVVTPFYNNDVFTPFANHVAHVVIIATCVLHGHFLAWTFGSVHTNVQDVIAWKRNNISVFYINSSLKF